MTMPESDRKFWARMREEAAKRAISNPAPVASEHEWHRKMPMKRLHATCDWCFDNKLKWMVKHYDPHVQRNAALLITSYHVPGYDEFVRRQGFEVTK